MFPGHGELGEPDLQPPVPITVVLQYLHSLVRAGGVVVGRQVVKPGEEVSVTYNCVLSPAAENLTLRPELVEPLGVGVASGRGHQGLVGVALLKCNNMVH